MQQRRRGPARRYGLALLIVAASAAAGIGVSVLIGDAQTGHRDARAALVTSAGQVAGPTAQPAAATQLARARHRFLLGTSAIARQLALHYAAVRNARTHDRIARLFE